jgi:hypothetical protein
MDLLLIAEDFHHLSATGALDQFTFQTGVGDSAWTFLFHANFQLSTINFQFNGGPRPTYEQAFVKSEAELFAECSNHLFGITVKRRASQ